MKKKKVSMVLNFLIVVLVAVASIFMFAGIKVTNDGLLDSTKLAMFKYFTVDSNLLVAIASIILIYYEKKLLHKEIKTIPKKVYVFKLMSTAAVTLTFLTTLLFLTPQYGFIAMFSNSNLFFHLIVPLISIISYIFFEHHNNKYRYALYGLIPMFIYSIYYTSNILLHLNSGGLTIKYDFYGFLRGDISNIIYVIPIIYIFTYLISLVLVMLNKKFSR